MFLGKGFQAFISKPVDLNRLDAVLRQWVRNKDAEALLPEHFIQTEAKPGKGKSESFEKIPGLDIKKGIARFGHNEKTYFDVLWSFATNTKPLLEDVKDVDPEKLHDYYVIVHGIKGASRGIFAEDAGNRAEALEFAANAGDYDFVIANNKEFIDTVSRLISDIEDALVKYGKAGKPSKDKPDTEILISLKRACESFDIDGMDAAMSEIEKYQYSSDDGLTAGLRDNLDQGKYKNIMDLLKHV